jgi:hypothetical protein
MDKAAYKQARLAHLKDAQSIHDERAADNPRGGVSTWASLEKGPGLLIGRIANNLAMNLMDPLAAEPGQGHGRH